MKYIYKVDSPQAMEVPEDKALKMVASGDWVYDPKLRALAEIKKAKSAPKKNLEVKADDPSNSFNK